jgi:elongation factor G
MAKLSPQAIINVAMLGHTGSGKTTLLDAILLHTGIIKTLGSIEEGTTQSDSSEEEKSSKRSIYNGVFSVENKSQLLNIIDCPGYFDFVSQPIMALSAVETAVIAVNGKTGVEVGTRKMWEYAEKAGAARMVVITRLDEDEADFTRTLGQLKTVFGPHVTPIVVPNGKGSGLKGVVSLLGDNIPEEFSDYKETFVENVISADDALLEKYLETGKVDASALENVMRKAISSGAVVPVVPVSAEKGIGVAEMLEVWRRCLPTAATPVRRVLAAEDKTEIVKVDDVLRACVFKVSMNEFVGRISTFRIYSGTINAAATINLTTGSTERVPKLYKQLGDKQIEVTEASAGEIVATAKVESLAFNVGIYTTKGEKKFEAPVFPTPLVSKAVSTTKRGDESRLSDAIRRIAEEDPTFQIRQDAETKEMVISAVGEQQLRVILERLKTRNKIELATSQPKIPYRETIVGKGDVRYRHKKQTGGAGQFAECAITVEPNQRGKGYEYIDKIFGGSISQQYRASVDKGIQEALKKGVLAGYPVVDVVVRLYDGKEHPVDSKDIAFQIAGRQAFYEATQQARPVLLEPIVNLEIAIPAKYMGDITGDISGRRGRVVGMDTMGDLQIIKAQAPLAEVLNYSSQLQSMTQGEGFFAMEASHYEVVPQHVAQQIIAAAKKTQEGGKEE